MTKSLFLLLICLLFNADQGHSWYPRLKKEMALTQETIIIGHNREYIAGSNETLMELGLRAGIGFENLVRANPGVDPWKPPAGERLILPRAALLPGVVNEGITINLAELRLYLIWDEDGIRKVRIYPVGIGREGWDTPLGDFKVNVLIENPAWTPPASLREEKPELPGIIPPGPDNPLGSFWIGLSAEGVGIHGSNQPLGVGRRVSHGCIRLYRQDISDLITRVRPGTPVRIINAPLKKRVQDGVLYLEVHSSIENPAELGYPLEKWDVETVMQTLREARGIPVTIPPLR